MNDSDTETDRSLSPFELSCFGLQLSATKSSLEEVEAALRHLRCIESHRLVKVLKLVRSTGVSPNWLGFCIRRLYSKVV